MGGQRYRFTRLPIGLARSPAFHQKTLEMVLAPIRSDCVVIWIHVDDILIAAPWYYSFGNLAREAIALLQQAGFVVNFNKSIVRPTQHLDYVGLRLN